MTRNKSLVTRLTGGMWLFSAISCVAAALLATFLIIRNSELQAKDRIKAEEANLVSLGLIDLISLNDFKELVPRIPETLQGGEGLDEVIRIYEPPGKLLFTNVKSPEIARAKVPRAKVVDKGFYEIEGKTHHYLALLRSYQAYDGDTLWIEIVTPRTSAIAVLQQIMLPFLLALTLLLILSYVIARIVTRKALMPLQSMGRQMDHLDVTQFKAWEPFAVAEQPKEFQPILGKVNELIARIQNAFLKFHRLGQFVAHEVRTPLTVIQGEIENALATPTATPEEYRETLTSCMGEVARIDEIVGTVLRVAKADAEIRPYVPETVDLGAFLGELGPKLEKYTGRKIRLSPGESAPLFADRELIGLLVSNLVQNVAKHTPAGTATEIRWSKRGENETELEILDRGPGLPPDILSVANSDQIGNETLGIGLTLCKQIAQISHLKLEFENRPEGGLLVRMIVPTAQPNMTKM
ncbi:MAG: ATP-binding protein [Pseudomonadota bacterium]